MFSLHTTKRGDGALLLECPEHSTNVDAIGVFALRDGSLQCLLDPSSNASESESPGVDDVNTISRNLDNERNKLGVYSTINILIGKIIGVGIFSIPSSIYSSVGSVGMCLLLWCIGVIISFCGLKVYIDLGSALPYSGGEKVYLERIFRRPRMLSTCMFMAFTITLGFSTPNCIVLGEYVLYALGYEPDRWGTRIIGTAAVSVICLIHWQRPKFGVVIINIFGATKLILLAFLFVSGIAYTVIGGDRTASIGSAQKNFTNIWAGTNTQPYALGTALLQILYCFRGYSAANQVLSSIRNPAKVLNIASTAALLIVSMCYLLANVAYFLVVDLEDFRNSGVMAAGLFFRNIFGATLGQKVISWFIIMSAFGNITATAYTQSRVNQELGREGILPFASWWGHESNQGAATQGLMLHWIITVIVIIVPPPGQLYNFLVSLGAYPVSVICTAITLGLIYLQSSPQEDWQSPHPAKRIYTYAFAISNIFLIILPWIRPEDRSTHSSDFPYYTYPLTGLCILVSGLFYWIWWRGSFRSMSFYFEYSCLGFLKNSKHKVSVRGEKQGTVNAIHKEGLLFTLDEK